MHGERRLTTEDVETVADQGLGRAVPVRLLEEKDRNQVFAVGEEAILKAYLHDGPAKQARKVAALRFLEGRGLSVPRLLGHGGLPGGVPWTLETWGGRRAPAAIPGRDQQPRRLGAAPGAGPLAARPHTLSGFPCFGTWEADGPTTLAGHVLPRARAFGAQTATLDVVSPALLGRAGQLAAAAGLSASYARALVAEFQARPPAVLQHNGRRPPRPTRIPRPHYDRGAGRPAAASCLVGVLEHAWTAIRSHQSDVSQVVILVRQRPAG
jgi:hypothetical protein